jgi:hypothetical protein
LQVLRGHELCVALASFLRDVAALCRESFATFELSDMRVGLAMLGWCACRARETAISAAALLVDRSTGWTRLMAKEAVVCVS